LALIFIFCSRIRLPGIVKVTIIERIKQRLENYPSLVYRATASHIEIDPPTEDGFSLSLYVSPSHFTVHFNGWHEEFSSEQSALDCFAFGLSDQSRLKVMRRGKFEYRWTLEFIDAGVWHEDSTTGLLFFPFWEKEQIVYRQNRVIIGPRPEGLRPTDGV
jgi:hypothetical protein